MGWTENKSIAGDIDQGIYSDGDLSMLIMKTEKTKFKVNLDIEPNILSKNYFFEMDIYINEKFYKKMIFNKKENYNLELIVNNSLTNNHGNIIIRFEFSHIKSPWSQTFNPDSRKLGILIKNIYFKVN